MMNTKNPLRLGRDAWGPWVPATRRLSTFSQCQCIATADVTVPLLPSEECACRLHEGVTEVLWKRYGLFSPVFPKWAHLFSLIKTGEVQKKKKPKKKPHTLSARWTFLFANTILRPYPSSPSFGALAEGQWCVLTTSGQQTWKPQCLYGWHKKHQLLALQQPVTRKFPK